MRASEHDPLAGHAIPSPDGKALDSVHEENGRWNIWSQPLEGGERRRLTNFAGMRIFGFKWSPDGKRFVPSRGEVRSDLVAISGFR